MSSDDSISSNSSSSSSSSFDSWCHLSDEEDRKSEIMKNCPIRLNKNMKGEKIDLVSYLRSLTRDYLVDKDGEKVSIKTSVEGKYVIIIWLELPVKSRTNEGRVCWALWSAISTSSSWSGNVQVVVVPRVGSEWAGEEQAALNSFLSGIPSCLAIPDTCHNPIYRCVWDYYNRSSIYGLVLDPSQIVLQDDHKFEFSIIEFGADFYPFTDERISTLHGMSRELMLERPFPLERLLGLELSDCLPNIVGDATIAVSELKKKLVGVYVVFSFRMFRYINGVYQDCLAKGRDLEIVLVCVNLWDDPQHYMDSVYAALRDNDKAKGILSSWWVLPQNDCTQCRLWKLCDRLRCNEDEIEEDLIIVGPEGRFFDPQGLSFIGPDPSIYDMYPYAVEGIAQQEIARLQSLTVESLFGGDHHLVTQQGDLVSVTKLRGKKVLLFIADFQEGYKRIMTRMRDYWCPRIKLKCEGGCSNTAVVFVPLNSSGLIFTEDLDPRMFWLWDPTIPWLISPPNHVREGLIIKSLSLKELGRKVILDQLSSCIAFGEDGHFVSKVLYNLSEFMAADFSPDHLYNYVLEQYCEWNEKAYLYLK